MTASPSVLAEPRARPEPVATCRACGSPDVVELMPSRSVPLCCNVLWATREQAGAAGRGPLRLAACCRCDHVFNADFNAGLLDYTPDYHNSLHHSEHFSAYAQELARRLAERHDLRGKLIVDVGCGLGDFLKLICRIGDNRGLGFDRSCPPDAAAGPDVTFVPSFFTRDLALDPIDLLCCRQVLEHIADPIEFLNEIKSSAAVTDDTVLFFEVPNAAYTLRDDGIWDLIYEHCSYFGRNSLVRLFECCGFEVLSLDDLFYGQYLGLEARLARDDSRRWPLPGEDAAVVETFRDRYQTKLDRWRAAIAAWAAAGERIVIWGAGSKGVTFLDALGSGPIDYAVDLNPRKQGRFLPSSGAQVVAPEFLTGYRPDRVVLMNAVYRDEVATALGRLGLAPALVSA